MEDWSNEKVQQLVAEGDAILGSGPLSTLSDPRVAYGKYAFAHMMLPRDFGTSIRVASCLARESRDEEATALCDFAFNHLKDEKHLSSPTLRNHLDFMANAYYRVGAYEKSLRLARLTHNSTIASASENGMRMIDRPFRGEFPEGIVRNVLMSEYNCELNSAPLHNDMCVRNRLDAKKTSILWLRDESYLRELDEEKLGRLIATPLIICNSLELRALVLRQLPFFDQNKVLVILDAYDGVLPSLERSDERSHKVLFRGNAEGLAFVKAVLEDFQGQFHETEFVVLKDEFIPPEHRNASIFLYCSNALPTLHDLSNIVEAQIHGIVPICSAFGGVPEYLIGGSLVRPPFNEKHLKIFESTLKHALMPDSLHVPTPDYRRKLAAEAQMQFSARRIARKWLHLINRIRAKSVDRL